MTLQAILAARWFATRGGDIYADDGTFSGEPVVWDGQVGGFAQESKALAQHICDCHNSMDGAFENVMVLMTQRDVLEQALSALDHAADANKARGSGESYTGTRAVVRASLARVRA